MRGERMATGTGRTDGRYRSRRGFDRRCLNGDAGVPPRIALRCLDWNLHGYTALRRPLGRPVSAMNRRHCSVLGNSERASMIG